MKEEQKENMERKFKNRRRNNVLGREREQLKIKKGIMHTVNKK